MKIIVRLFFSYSSIFDKWMRKSVEKKHVYSDFRWLEINLKTLWKNRKKNGHNLKNSRYEISFFEFHGIVNLRLFVTNMMMEDIIENVWSKFFLLYIKMNLTKILIKTYGKKSDKDIEYRNANYKYLNCFVIF